MASASTSTHSAYLESLQHELTSSIPLNEDTVSYALYPSSVEVMLLEEDLVSISAFVNREIGDYIWQHDPFSLAIQSDPTPPPEETPSSSSSSSSSTTTTPPPPPSVTPGEEKRWMAGVTKFGDNIEDEWLIVRLLLQISVQFPEYVISVVDGDGQFLLIEAAMELPRWLKPQNSSMRVWLHRGNIHIIPLPRTPMELMVLPAKLDLPTAIELVSDDDVDTLAPEPIVKLIKDRLSIAHEAFLKSTHNTELRLPASVAYLLHSRPQLVAKAVTKYYHRDPLLMRSCKKMSRFPNESPRTVVVPFTRCLYAQLLSQRLDFTPEGFPRVATAGAPPSSPSSPSPSSSPSAPPAPARTRQEVAEEMGQKLCCGFEMLYQASVRRENRAKRASGEAVNVTIDKILAEGAPSQFQVPESDLTPSSAEWLTISPEALEAMMAKKEEEVDALNEMDKDSSDGPGAKEKSKGGAGGAGNEGKEPSRPRLFDEIVSEMNAFMGKESDYTGVELDGEEEEDFEVDGAKKGTKTSKMDSFFTPELVEREERLLREEEEEVDDEAFLDFFRQKYGGKMLGEEDGDSEEDAAFYDEDMGAPLEEIKKVMASMDSELFATNVGQSIPSNPTTAEGGPGGDGVDADDINLVSNFLSSYEGQGDAAGPVSNFLNVLLKSGSLKDLEGAN